MEKHLIESMKSSFDSIMHVDEDGVDDVQELMDKMKLFSSEDYDSNQNVDVSNIKKRVRRREKNAMPGTKGTAGNIESHVSETTKQEL